MVTTLAKKLMIVKQSPLLSKRSLFRHVLRQFLNLPALPDVNKIKIKNLLNGKPPFSDYNNTIGLGYSKGVYRVDLRHPSAIFFNPRNLAAEIK